MAEHDDLGRHLRSRVGEDFRSDAEETEHLAAQAARRRRTLVDVVRDAMGRGDGVVARVGRRTFTGPVVHVGQDYVSIGTPAGRVDVRTAGDGFTLRVAHRPDGVGRDRRPGAETFKARLLELELARAVVVLGVPQLECEHVGRVAAVGADHVAITDGVVEDLVPLGSVGYVTERSGEESLRR